jgi:hypothetical protein
MFDARIARDVLDGLIGDDRIDANDVNASVLDGVVTLTGRVGTLYEKWVAGEDAAGVGGVASVRNDIEVDASESRPEDSELAMAAAIALARNGVVPFGAVDIVALNGWITRRGTSITTSSARPSTIIKETVDDARSCARSTSAPPRRSISTGPPKPSPRPTCYEAPPKHTHDQRCRIGVRRPRLPPSLGQPDGHPRLLGPDAERSTLGLLVSGGPALSIHSASFVHTS